MVSHKFHRISSLFHSFGFSDWIISNDLFSSLLILLYSQVCCCSCLLNSSVLWFFFFLLMVYISLLNLFWSCLFSDFYTVVFLCLFVVNLKRNFMNSLLGQFTHLHFVISSIGVLLLSFDSIIFNWFSWSLIFVLVSLHLSKWTPFPDFIGWPWQRQSVAY